MRANGYLPRVTERAGLFNYLWYWRSRMPHRKGQRCRVLILGGLNSALVQFEDGQRVVTSRYAVRKLTRL